MIFPHLPGSCLATAGHHFLTGLAGVSLSKNEKLDLKELQPLGVVLRAHNFAGDNYAAWLEQFAALRSEVIAEIGRDKVVFAVEYDGGKSHPLPPPLTRLPEAALLAPRAGDAGQLLAAELSAAGLNMLLGPLADIAPVFARSPAQQNFLGADADTVTEAACRFSLSMRHAGVKSCPKHFPGVGNTTMQENYPLPQLNYLKDEIMNRDVTPFAALIDIGVPVIMAASAFYPSIDRDFPAFSSKKLLKEILRDHLRFTGVVVTDDLAEPDLKKSFVDAEIARNAIAAGCDLLYTSSMEQACALADRLLDAYKIRALTEDELRNSTERLQLLYDSLSMHNCRIIDEVTLRRHVEVFGK